MENYNAPIKIDRGVPVPTKGQRCMYPFKDMKVGDSFFIDTKDRDKGNMRNRVQSSSSRFAKMQDPKQQFCSRQLEGGIRCWRIL